MGDWRISKIEDELVKELVSKATIVGFAKIPDSFAYNVLHLLKAEMIREQLISGYKWNLVPMLMLRAGSVVKLPTFLQRYSVV